MLDSKQQSLFEKNLDKYVDFASWMLWYPDEFLDLLKPKDGGINLHADQRVFLRCATRFFSMYGCFPRGWGKCVAGDTLLYTDGGLAEIGEFFNYRDDDEEDVYVHNIGVVDKNGDTKKSTCGIYSGYKPTKKITTHNMFEIEGTHVHPILIMDKDGKIKFKKLSEIVVGDIAVISRNNRLWGHSTAISVQDKLNVWVQELSKQSSSHLRIRDMPTELSLDFAYLMGLLIGDGCLTRDNMIIFSNIDEGILASYFRIMETLFESKAVCYEDSGDYVTHDKYLRKYLDLCGLSIGGSHGKMVPSVILSAPREHQKEFLMGLFDTDGTVNNRLVSYCTVSKKMAQQIQAMLLNFGIVSRMTHNVNKNSQHHYKLYISGEEAFRFADEIGFKCKRKQDILSSLVQKKHNTNNNVIYHQENFVRELLSECPRGVSSRGQLYNVSVGENRLSYDRLDKILKNDEVITSKFYKHWKDIQARRYYFDPIIKIEDGMNHVYDLHVPGTHSFVSNGFVSHNTWSEVMALFVVAIRYPNIELSLTAQTRENAVRLLREKYTEIVRFYPLLENEIKKISFTKNDAEIEFKNNARIDALANSSSSKGLRRKRIMIEESALLDNVIFEDALKPIVEVSRSTCGKLAVINPEELNQQIHFFSTPAWRGSDEHVRSIDMVRKMINLQGEIVLGSDWKLGCWYGRGSSRSQILDKKRTMSPVAFDQNYGGRWTGSSSGALVNINKLMKCRSLTTPLFETQKDTDEYYIGVDVARSQKTSNNQSAIVVGKVNRNPATNRIITIDVVNVIGVPNILNFTAQAALVKQIANRFRAKMVVVDGNGLGSGLVDELLKESKDPITKESLGCWATINTDNEPEIPGAERCVYDLKSQGIQSRIVTVFIDMVESGRLRLLEARADSDFSDQDRENYKEFVVPFVQTDLLFEEISNLKIKNLSGGGMTVEKVVYKVDKDRYSALAYMLWYIAEFENKLKAPVDREEFLSMFAFKKPETHRR